jgi:hypothetical protein
MSIKSDNDALIARIKGVAATPSTPEIESDPTNPNVFFHSTPKPDACAHDFKGWREFEDGCGGEQVCTKCGMGAMTYSLRTGI